MIYKRLEQLRNRATGKWYTARVYVRAHDERHAFAQFELGAHERVEVYVGDDQSPFQTFPTPVEECSVLEQLAFIELDDDP